MMSNHKHERWGENEEAGTVRILDLLTRLFSVVCDGGEGGVRYRSQRPQAGVA